LSVEALSSIALRGSTCRSRREPGTNLSLEFATDFDAAVIVEDYDQPMATGADESTDASNVDGRVPSHLHQTKRCELGDDCPQCASHLDRTAPSGDHRVIPHGMDRQDVGPGDEFGGRAPADRDPVTTDHPRTRFAKRRAVGGPIVVDVSHRRPACGRE